MKTTKAQAGILIAVISALLLATSVYSQSGRQPAPRRTDQDEPLKLRAEEVLLNVTVLDPYGHQAIDLTKDEFIIAEDGQRQDIASFVLSTVPVNVVLLLDASGSVVTEINSLRDAAMEFVNQLSPEDRTSIIEFHSNLELIQDWTGNSEDVKHALSWRFKPGMVQASNGSFGYGSTALFDAIFATADDQLTKVQGRKAVILLTDGDDTSSKLTFQQAAAAVTRSGAVVYVISKAREFINSLDKYRGKAGSVFAPSISRSAQIQIGRFEQAERLMTELATRSGGRIYSPLANSEMKGVYQQVAHELKNQYIVTYIPKNLERDGKLRRVNVYLTRSGYVARTRDSYYAPKK